MVFEDRVAKYPGRWTMVKSDGTSEIVTLIRNDEPTKEGTPINAATLNELSTVAGAINAKEEAVSAASIANSAAASAAQSAQSASADAKSAGNSATSAKAEADRAAAIVSTDKTLSVEGAPADAKAVGDALKGIKLPIATATTLGGIKSGKGLKISADGTASIDAYSTTETDSLLNALQENVDNKISSATSIAASGDGYIRFADGTQICWRKFSKWPYNGNDPYFPFPVPFANTNYGAGFTLGHNIGSDSTIECYVTNRATTGLYMRNAYEGSIVVIGRWK